MDGFGRLHDAFGDRLRILGFPTNDFGRQQGTEEELRRDFSRVLDVLFEPTTTSDNPVLNRVQREDRGGAPLEWNFVKVLIDDRGRVILRYGPSMDYDKIARDVKEEL